MRLLRPKLCYLTVLLVFQTTVILCEESVDDDSTISNPEKTYPTEVVTQDKVDTNIDTNVTIVDKTLNATKYVCIQEIEHGPVELVNATRLVDVVKDFVSNKTRSKDKNAKTQPGHCVLIMFYATWCIFSSQAAPHFNALPKFYPYIKFVAIDAMKHQHFNSHYGIVGVPTLMMLHDGKPAAKFNDTVYSIETFSKFITQLTNQQPNGSLHVTSADFSGPVSSVPVNETDWCLILAWLFIAVCAMYYTSRSHWWRQFVESVQNTWRESNAQHEHAE